MSMKTKHRKNVPLFFLPSLPVLFQSHKSHLSFCRLHNLIILCFKIPSAHWTFDGSGQQMRFWPLWTAVKLRKISTWLRRPKTSYHPHRRFICLNWSSSAFMIWNLDISSDNLASIQPILRPLHLLWTISSRPSLLTFLPFPQLCLISPL